MPGLGRAMVPALGLGLNSRLISLLIILVIPIGPVPLNSPCPENGSRKQGIWAILS
jgi:hypothetical protein